MVSLPVSALVLFCPFCCVGGEQEVNTVEAIWMKSPSEVEDAKYDEFYKFIAKAYDEPLAKVQQKCKHGHEQNHFVVLFPVA